MTRERPNHDATPTFEFENAAQVRLGPQAVICGVDEAGRGPLAGPVVAAAVALPGPTAIAGLNDSKKLTERRRNELFEAILAGAQVGIGAASVREIDHLNILRANDLAMRRAVFRLPSPAALALIDGNRAPPDLGCAAETIVKGDARCLSIAAASIVAKVVRDRVMTRLARRYDVYGWEKNAGYPTKAHRAAIATAGPTPHHRRSFRLLHSVD